jgi:hypothetical protein
VRQSKEQGENDGDISPYVARKLSFSNNLELHNQDIRKQLESIDTLIPTSPFSQHEQTDSAGPCEHSKGSGGTRGTGGRGGSKQPTKKTVNPTRNGQAPPDSKKRKRVDEDGNAEDEDDYDDDAGDYDEEPGDGAACKSHLCMTPDDRCRDRRFQTLESLL